MKPGLENLVSGDDATGVMRILTSKQSRQQKLDALLALQVFREVDVSLHAIVDETPASDELLKRLGINPVAEKPQANPHRCAASARRRNNLLFVAHPCDLRTTSAFNVFCRRTPPLATSMIPETRTSPSKFTRSEQSSSGASLSLIRWVARLLSKSARIYIATESFTCRPCRGSA